MTQHKHETSHPHGLPIGLQPSDHQLRITTQSPKSLDTQYGSVATLSCKACGGPPGQVITYQWYKDGTTVPSDNTGDLRISTVTCADQGQYQCVASCGNITAESDPVNLHVELDEADHINITEHPKDLHARVNETITLKCQAHNESGKDLVYQWFKDNNKVADGPEFKIHLNYKRHATYKCYCRVSLKDCDEKFVISIDAKVTVDMLWFTVQPRDFDGYVGEPAILYCKAGLHPETKISYLWLKSSTPDGATNPLTVSEEDTLVIQSLNDSHYGYYTCQASATNQVISSRTVSVSAKIRDACEEKKAPVIRFTKQPRSRAVEKGKPFSLVCKAIASSWGVSFQWYKDCCMIPEQQKERLDGVATLDNFGSYYCVVKTTNAYGCVLSETAQVCMLEQPVQTSMRNSRAQLAEWCYRTKEEVHFAQEKVALLIGNGHYNEMEDLKAIESDIRNLHATLTVLGFKVISLLDLKYYEMIEALEQFYKYLQSGVYAVFYFSGHGFNVNNITYLMPTDAKKEPLNCNQCISSKTIQNRILEKCAIGVALLDCCKVSDGGIVSSSSSDAAALDYATYLEISACHDGFFAFADATRSVFNKALIPSLKKKVPVNNLDQEILTEMRKMNQNIQSPFRKGTILHKEMTLHDPIMLSNEGAEEIMDFLSQQYSWANSVPDPMSIKVEPYAVQLGLSFSAEFSNVLKVQIRPLAGNNISVISIVVNVENSQNVNASSDKVSDGSFSFKIESIQRAVWPLKLCMKVTVSIDGREQCISHMHELKDKFMFASLI